MAWRSMPRLSAWLHELLHHLADVLDVEPGAVEGAVRGDRREHLADRGDAAFARRFGGFHAPAPPRPTPMIMPCRRRSNGSAASSTTSSVAAAPLARKPDPVQGRSVSEATSSAEMTTTRRQRPARIQSSARAQCLGRARAGGVHLRVRAARADQFGELRVTHRQRTEQEAAVEGERVGVQRVPQVGDAPVHLGDGRVCRAHPRCARPPASRAHAGRRGPRDSG